MEDTEWNAWAEKLNTESFISTFHREPENYAEVLSWVYEILEELHKQPLHPDVIERYDVLRIPHDGCYMIPRRGKSRQVKSITIKQRRKELGISRRTMATLLSITTTQYKALEDNIGEMPYDIFVVICNYFDIETTDIKIINTYPILRRKRLIRGLSLRYAAHKAGMNVFAYWIAERRCRSLDNATLQRIAKVVAPEMELSAFVSDYDI